MSAPFAVKVCSARTVRGVAGYEYEVRRGTEFWCHGWCSGEPARVRTMALRHAEDLATVRAAAAKKTAEKGSSQ